MHKYFFAITFALVLLLNFVSLLFLPINVIVASKNNEVGHVQIKVLEANTLRPVSDATVCVIETHSYKQTDHNGDCAKFEIPIKRNTNFDDVLLRNWGEFTLLIYKQGYASHISFYNEVFSGITKIGLVCYLTPIVSASDSTITVDANVPNQTYIETLVAHYKKS